MGACLVPGEGRWREEPEGKRLSQERCVNVVLVKLLYHK